MQLFIYVKPSSLPPRIPELIPLRKQMLYYMRAGKLRLIWRLLRLLVSQWLVGEETAGMNCTAPHRQCALWPCFTFWTPALLFLQGGMELEPLLLNKHFGGCLQAPAGRHCSGVAASEGEWDLTEQGIQKSGDKIPSLAPAAAGDSSHLPALFAAVCMLFPLSAKNNTASRSGHGLQAVPSNSMW